MLRIVSGMGELPSRIGMLYVWFTVVVSVFLYPEGGLQAAEFIGLTSMLAACLIATWSGPAKLNNCLLVVFLGSVVVSLGMSASLGFSSDELGRRLIELAGYCLGIVAIRGHVRTASAGGALIMLAFAASVSLGGASVSSLDVAILPLLAVTLGLAWNWILRRSVRRAQGHRRRESIAAERNQAARTTARVLAEQIHISAEAALPILRHIQLGSCISEKQRAVIRVTEATIRDRLRIPKLARPSLVQAITEARLRGVIVKLLDVSDPETPLPARITDDIEGFICAAQTGSITIRLLPKGRGAFASIFRVEGVTLISQELV